MVGGATGVTKPYEIIGFGAMDVTKPSEIIGAIPNTTKTTKTSKNNRTTKTINNHKTWWNSKKRQGNFNTPKSKLMEFSGNV